MSGELNDRRVGRWTVAVVMSALMVSGFLGSVGAAYAGGGSDDNVGSPGGDGQDVTCFADESPHESSPVCNVVGENGEDGAPGADYR